MSKGDLDSINDYELIQLPEISQVQIRSVHIAKPGNLPIDKYTVKLLTYALMIIKYKYITSCN